MAGVAFAVDGDGVGFATESYAASALYTTLASLSGALWRIRRASAVAILPRKKRLNDPNLRDRLYELLEHDQLPYWLGSRFAQLIVCVIIIDVLAMILASVPEFDARFGTLFTVVKVGAGLVFALEYAGRLWSRVCHLA